MSTSSGGSEKAISSGIKRVDSLEIDQDMEYQRREWIAERIGWVAMLLIALAALAGLVGEGPLSTRTARAPDDGLSLDYHRFIRHHAPTTLTFHIPAKQTSDGEAELWIGRSYLASMQIERITPEPAQATASDERQLFTFRVKPGEPAQIVFHLDPNTVGSVGGAAGLGDGEPLVFEQFAYP